MSINIEQQQAFLDWISKQTWSDRTKGNYIYWFKRWVTEYASQDLAESVKLFCETYPSCPARATIKNYLEFVEAYNIRLPKLRGRKAVKMPKWISFEQVQELKKYCLSIGNDRELMLICLLFDGALRISEALQITPNDVDFVNCRIKITGKGRKEAYVKVSRKTSDMLKFYISKRKKMPSDKVFDVSRCTAGIRLSRVSKKAIGISIRPHALRHSMATYMLQKGMELIEVQKYLRHNNISTTAIYTHIVPKKLEEHMELLLNE